MEFQVNALSVADFAPLFSLSDEELAERAARRVVADTKPGYPCRVSLAEAEIGETLILVNYEHLAEDTPYRSSHAIFVKQGAKQALPEPGEIPESLRSRLLSIRGFNREHQMVAAVLEHGREVNSVIREMFNDPEVQYLHLHNAKPGCFAASVTRV